MALAACCGPAHGADLSACRAGAGDPPTPACRQAIAGAGVGEVLALIAPWASDGRYAGALRVLEEARRLHPSNSLLRMREHEVQGLADDAAWLARWPGDAAARPAADLALEDAVPAADRRGRPVRLRPGLAAAARRPTTPRRARRPAADPRTPRPGRGVVSRRGGARAEPDARPEDRAGCWTPPRSGATTRWRTASTPAAASSGWTRPSTTRKRSARSSPTTTASTSRCSPTPREATSSRCPTSTATGCAAATTCSSTAPVTAGSTTRPTRVSGCRSTPSRIAARSGPRTTPCATRCAP